MPGSYFIRFVLPEGFRFTLQDASADDAVDSDVATVDGVIAVGVEAGQLNLNVDAGLVALSASVGNRVWLDADADGRQDPGEAGVAGVAVTLFEALDLQTVATATTGEDGRYAFTALTPGRYLLEFTPPEGFLFSPPDRGGDDVLDSDVNPATATTPAFTLSAGEDDPTLDAGLFELGSIGNLVWSDEDGDGVRDPGEPGVQGVTVRLLDATGIVLDALTTTQRGRYLFERVTPGRYFVEAVAPEGFTFSPQDQAEDDVDSDANPGDRPYRSLSPPLRRRPPHGRLRARDGRAADGPAPARRPLRGRGRLA